ncbi:MAG TPA: NAD(P)H-hydrate dehydratase [Candidatus Binatia bacterium]
MKIDAASASVLSREAMRDLDAATIASGTPSLELMERAGAAIAAALEDRELHAVELPERPRLLVVAGRGNNGGDGFVVARLLAGRGWQCTVGLVEGDPAPGGDAARNLEEWTRVGGRTLSIDETRRLIDEGAPGHDLVLDAIFGTGLVRPVEDPARTIIESLNSCGLPVVAADISSGLGADSGTPLGAAVRCRATVTIGAAKPGLFLADGPDFAGRVRVVDIGLCELDAAGVVRQGIVLDAATTAGSLPRLVPLSHKGSRGHVFIVAGSRGKTGAAILAARGALRSGAGLVTVVGVADVQAAVSRALPEAMTLSFPADDEGRLREDAADRIAAAVAEADAIVVGPGIGRGPGPDAVVAALLAVARPLILDADALNAVASWDGPRRHAAFGARSAAGSPKVILTPHPGEMARLVATTGARVQLSRKVFADKIAQELGCVVVLKGAATIVSDGVTTAFNTTGNPGMATGGSGDVLAGMLGALAARLAPLEAARLGVYVHGMAGDALYCGGRSGFLASEIADAVPAALASRQPK